MVFMGIQDDSEQARKYNEYGQLEHKAEVSHQLIAGAGAYEVRTQILANSNPMTVKLMEFSWSRP